MHWCPFSEHNFGHAIVSVLLNLFFLFFLLLPNILTVGRGGDVELAEVSHRVQILPTTTQVPEGRYNGPPWIDLQHEDDYGDDEVKIRHLVSCPSCAGGFNEAR